eukprot:gene1613-1145_t
MTAARASLLAVATARPAAAYFGEGTAPGAGEPCRE